MSSVDFEEHKTKRKKCQSQNIGIYEAERVIGKRGNGEVCL